MYEAIKNFNTQFGYVPEIKNKENLVLKKKYIVAGMGGSQLATGLIQIWNPELEIISHRDYGLPAMPEEALTERIVILSSYSGNTEEVIDAFEKAKEKKLAMAVISVGG